MEGRDGPSEYERLLWGPKVGSDRDRSSDDPSLDYERILWGSRRDDGETGSSDGRSSDYERKVWESRGEGVSKRSTEELSSAVEEKTVLDKDTQNRITVRKVTGWIVTIMGWFSLVSNIITALGMVVLLLGALVTVGSIESEEEDQDNDTGGDPPFTQWLKAMIVYGIFVFLVIALVTTIISILTITAGNRFRKGKNRAYVAIIVGMMSLSMIFGGFIGIASAFVPPHRPGMIPIGLLFIAFGGGLGYSIFYTWNTFEPS